MKHVDDKTSVLAKYDLGIVRSGDVKIIDSFERTEITKEDPDVVEVELDSSSGLLVDDSITLVCDVGDRPLGFQICNSSTILVIAVR